MAEQTSRPLLQRWGFWLAVVVAVPVVALLWWLISPRFFDEPVDEAFPMSAGATVPEDMTQEEVEAEMAAAAVVERPTEEPMTEDMAAATAILRGEFVDADPVHRGSGTATIYRLEDGSHVLRFEDFRVTNGPDLRVFLNVSDTDMAASVELGDLKGNVGNQNYDIPADVDVESFTSVSVYCVPFSVTFTRAALTPVS